MPTSLRHRPDLTELLDAPAPDQGTLGANLRDIRLINRWLGWTGAMAREAGAVMARLQLREATLLDVATGSGDIPLAVARQGARRGLAIHAIGGDISRSVLAAARAVTPLDLVCFDAAHAPFADASMDIVTCSLALHHFPPDAAVTVLRELGRITRRALIVSDLERSWPGYLGARLLVTLLRNPMTHHDAPVSVLRAYTRAELRALAHTAGLTGARVTSRFPFRLLLEWPSGQADL
ncbi:MAG: methyltransferase domain-containing protein [Thermomicrobiales bacterium]